jgi:hypothetical protein
MSLSNYAETALLNHIFRGTAFTQPAALYLALYTSDPTDADVGTEVSGGAYARQSFTGTVTGDTFTASANIEFPVATATWGTITHVGIRDAASGGNLLASAALSTARTINNGDVFRETSLTVQLD